MEFKEITNADLINLNLNAKTKKEAINVIAKMLYENNRISDLSGFIENVYKREKLESTNMGGGIAIPHSISDFVNKASIAIGRFNDPVDWEDGEDPISYIFLFAVSPLEKGITHLELISQMAVILIDEDFINFLHKTNDKEMLFNKISELLGGKI